MFRQRLDLNTNATIQSRSNELKKEIVATSVNNWASNNGNFLNDITLTYLTTSTPLDMNTIDVEGTSRKIFFTGKMNMADASDSFVFVLSNGVNDFLGESIRPRINVLDNMYHFSYTMDSFDRYIKVSNINSTHNNITNLTINYTLLK
tara:strand:- start:68 stop:511 length:444 start_codon:yes stop_codon:yes gene_type:complete